MTQSTRELRRWPRRPRSPRSRECETSRGAKSVTDPANRLNQSRLVVFFELASQVTDVDGQRVGARVKVVSPHEIQDLVPGENLARVTQEQFQQIELDFGQFDQARAAMDLASRRVEGEILKAKHRAVDVADVVASQECSQSRQQLGQVEGLDEVVIGADVKTLDAVVDRVARRQHQDGSGVT